MSLDEFKQPVDPNPAEEKPAADVEENTSVPADSGNVADDPLSAFAEVSRKDDTKSKKKGMTKRTRNLVFTSVVAVVLAVILLVVTLLPAPGAGGSSGGTSSTDTGSGHTVLDKTLEDKDAITVKQVEVKNAETSFTIYYNAKDKVYQLKGYEDLTLNSYTTEELAKYASLISATDKVDQPDNLADYGLDKPIATATMTYHDDSKATLLIGSTTPSKDGYYIKLADSDEVYICPTDAVAVFTALEAVFVDTTLLTAPTVKKDDANGKAVLKEISYSGKNHKKPFSMRRVNSTDHVELLYYTYIITKPYFRGTSDVVTNSVSTFSSLSASQAVFLHPTAEQKKALGFNDPLIVMEMTMSVETTEESENKDEDPKTVYYNSYTTTLTVGEQDEDGNYLVMVDGIDAIFLVAKDSLSAVADRTYDNSVTTLLFLKDITQLGRISITSEGKTHDFKLTHKADEEDSDKKMTVTIGSDTYSTQEFRELYQLMMGLLRYGVQETKPTSNPAVTIDMYLNDGSHYLGVKLYPHSGSLYVAETTEGELFTTRAAEVNHFIKQIENYINGKDVLTLV